MSYGPHPNDFLLAECELYPCRLVRELMWQTDSSLMTPTPRLYISTI